MALDPVRDFRLERDAATKKVVAAWVRWKPVPDLGGTGPHDRVYTIDRARGQVVFGDDRRGRIPPPGANSIVARSYRTGGGRAGNVAAGVLNQVLSSLPNVIAAGNPQSTTGGADGESLEVEAKPDASTSPIVQFLAANPASAVFGGSGLSPIDLAALAKSSSSQVISALALRDGPGRVRLVVVAQDDRAPGSGPDGDPDHLDPSTGLKGRLRDVFKARMPEWGARGVRVAGPKVRTVAVAVRVLADATTAGGDLDDLRRSVERAITAYLNPRTGGPDGLGWLAAGGSVALASDLARRVAKVEGVARTLEIALSVAGGPPVDRVVLSPGVVAAPDRTAIRAEVVAGEMGGTSS